MSGSPARGTADGAAPVCAGTREPPAAAPRAWREPVVLVGFMGAGKSAVGAALAARLDLPFLDCDAVIERTEGTIPEIFAQRGEEGFRALERGIVTETLRRALDAPAVVALGGGAVLSPEVRDELGRQPHVVWLAAAAQTLWGRVTGGGTATRPLARDDTTFRRLYDERAPLYAAVARLRVDNDDARSVADVVDEIVARLSAGDVSPGAAT